MRRLSGSWALRVYLVALGIRLLWAVPVLLHPDRALDPDSPAYQKLALNLLHEHRFSQDYPEPGTPEVFRTPGYPLFLALVYGIFGQGNRWVVLVQALLGALVPLGVYLALRQSLGEATSRWGSLFLALWPEHAVYSSRILSDTLYQVILVGVFAALWRAMEKDRWRWLLGALGLLGLALYVRPAAAILLPVVPGWFLLRARPLNRQALLHLLAGFVVFLLVISPWVYRNLRLTHRPLWSTVALVNLVFYDIAAYEGRLQGKPFDANQQAAFWQQLRQRAGWPEASFWQLVNDPDRLDQALRLTLGTLSWGDRFRLFLYRWAVGLRLLFHPGYRTYAAVLHPPALQAPGWGFLKFGIGGNWASVLRAKLLDQPPGFVVALAFVYLVELLGGALLLVGAWRLLRQGQSAWVLLPVAVYLLLALAAGLNMNPRFRANYSLLLVPLWGTGLDALMRRWRQPEG